MRKIIIPILITIFMIGLVNGIEECKGTISTEESPCYILLANSSGLNCNTINVSVYFNATDFRYTQTMDDFSPFNCNGTFNQTDVGTYTFQYTTGDTGSIIIQESETMSIAISLVTSGFGGLILLLGLVLFIYSSLKNKEKNKETVEFGEVSKPRLAILDVIASGMIALGFLLFLVGLHLMTIRSSGDTATVLNYVFISFLWVYIAILIFGVVMAIIQLLRWLVWHLSTPTWKKKRG